jgi:hypothetical protein
LSVSVPAGRSGDDAASPLMPGFSICKTPRRFQGVQTVQSRRVISGMEHLDLQAGGDRFGALGAGEPPVDDEYERERPERDRK